MKLSSRATAGGMTTCTSRSSTRSRFANSSAALKAGPEAFEKSGRRDAQRRLQPFLAKAKKAGVRAGAAVVEGIAAEEIIREARHRRADLIVIGPRPERRGAVLHGERCGASSPFRLPRLHPGIDSGRASSLSCSRGGRDGSGHVSARSGCCSKPPATPRAPGLRPPAHALRRAWLARDLLHDGHGAFADEARRAPVRSARPGTRLSGRRGMRRARRICPDAVLYGYNVEEIFALRFVLVNLACRWPCRNASCSSWASYASMRPATVASVATISHAVRVEVVKKDL